MQTLETLIPHLQAHFGKRITALKVNFMKITLTDEELRYRANWSNEHVVQFYCSNLANIVVKREKEGLKAGDWVTYVNPYDNVLVNCRVIGWDKDEQLYLGIDCYWMPVKREEVFKQESKITYRGYFNE